MPTKIWANYINKVIKERRKNGSICIKQGFAGGRVMIPEELKSKSYYKYYLIDMEPLPQELRDEILNNQRSVEEALEPEDRFKIQETKCYPEKLGVLSVKNEGCLVASNVKTPDITGEMLGWWAGWHGYNRLRYAIWNPQDHYNLELDEESLARITNPNIPPMEKLWGMTHISTESFDCEEPSIMKMSFFNPAEAGYDMSLLGTDRCGYIL